MSSNNNETKSKLSLRIQLAITVFILLLVFSTFFILVFHIIITTKSFDGTILGQTNSSPTEDNILSIAREIITKNFWTSLAWVLVASSLIDLVIAYAVAMWVSVPIETLLANLKEAYHKGLPYIGDYNQKFGDLQKISHVISDMTSKYLDAIEIQNLFIQDISHELKTPLAAIKSTGDLININTKPTIEDYKYYFQTSQLMNQRIINLVNQLTISNKADIELYDNEDINFSNLVKDMIKTHSPQIEAKKLKLHFDIENDIHVKGSPKYLSVAVSNLFDNAIKYSDKENGVIEVNLKQRRGETVLEINDQGIGIPEADLKNIFNRFYRGQNASEVSGTGLGLAITNKIIKAHSGKVILRSKLGSGSQARILL